MPQDLDNDFDLIGMEIQTDATTGTGKFKEAIDFLFAFAVKNELLIDYDKAQSIIREKVGRYSPRVTF